MLHHGGRRVRRQGVRTCVLALRASAVLGRLGLTVATGYLGVLTAAAASARQRRQPPPVGEPLHRFDLLIPAHNEERGIEAALASVARLDYPQHLLTAHVVADNCTDATADVARAAGVEVHERVQPRQAGKGPALQWLMARLHDRPEGTDAFVFMDADTTISPDFLRLVDDELRRGALVVQGHYAVRDVASAPAVAFRAAAFAAKTYLRPLGRAAIGGSAGLHGNGMAFRTDVMARRPWTSHLTEDVELHLDLLLLDGTLVAFAPAAKVEAEMPATLAAARSQHERWERGRIEIVRRYAPTLLRRTVTGGPARRLAYVDALLDQLVPPFSVIVAGSGTRGALAGARALLSPGPGRRRDVAVASSVVAVQLVYVLTALVLVRAPRSVYRSLLTAPRMVVWKLAVWLRALLRPAGMTWTRTTRN